MKGIIYYTDNRLDQLNRDAIIPELVKDSLLKSKLPITSCSLKPMDFGNNVVLNKEPGTVTMYEQILTALKHSTSKYVFFCEHDVIYHESHFKFTPARDDTFYYNVNAWRCHPRRNICVTYDDLKSVSGMCVNRDLAIRHYEERLKYIFDKGYDKLKSRNPKWARRMGYEPGKPVDAGGFKKEKIDCWKSDYPNIDIRHRLTLTIPKLSLDQFTKAPTNWQQVTVDKIDGWDLKKLFKL